MKAIGFFILFCLTACTATQSVHTATTNEKGYLVGLALKTDFQKAPYQQWFSKNYSDYSLDMIIVKRLKPLLKEVEITAVMGTWCSDSRREVPHFYKLLDAVDFNYKNLKMIAVDRSKTAPGNEQAGLNIIRVPTFIFYKNGKEINRFVEYPRETLEKDFLKILKGQGYKHSYQK